MRLLYELSEFPNSIFVTLTFDNPSLSRFSDNPNKSLLLFLDRIRKKYGKQVRHWFVAEYGKKRGRLHFHGILFDINIGNDELFSLWKYGNTFVGYANEITAKYIVKYLTKDDTKGLKCPPRVVTSKGIGSSFLQTSECQLLKATLSTAMSVGGFKIPLPRYYINSMYDKSDMEKISYYLYMESDFTYYVAGREYFNKQLADKARKELYKNHIRNGLVSCGYEKRKSISSDIRTRILFDVVSSYDNKDILYGKF